MLLSCNQSCKGLACDQIFIYLSRALLPTTAEAPRRTMFDMNTSLRISHRCYLLKALSAIAKCLLARPTKCCNAPAKLPELGAGRCAVFSSHNTFCDHLWKGTSTPTRASAKAAFTGSIQSRARQSQQAFGRMRNACRESHLGWSPTLAKCRGRRFTFLLDNMKCFSSRTMTTS